MWKWHGRALAVAPATNNTVAAQLAAKEALPVLHARIEDARAKKEDPCACVGVARREKEERKRLKKLAKGRAGEGGVAEVAGVAKAKADEGRAEVAAVAAVAA